MVKNTELGPLGTPPGLQPTWLRRRRRRDGNGVTVGCEEPQGRPGLSADLGCSIKQQQSKHRKNNDDTILMR